MTAFLQVPPFPGARIKSLQGGFTEGAALSDSEIEQCIRQVRALKVGGTYWATQPKVPDTPYTLIRVADGAQRSAAIAVELGPVVVWPDDGHFDPWYMLRNAKRVVVDSREQLALIAAIAGLPMECVGDGPFSALATGDPAALAKSFRSAAAEGACYVDPYTGAPISLSEAIDLCGFWRRLVDSNRSVSVAVGFGEWKRKTVAPLLWGGADDVRFETGRRKFASGEGVVVWKARTSARVLERLEANGARITEAEDGFVRSVGLGADCVPPLSIVVDSTGIYFDARSPSDLEVMLQSAEFDQALLERARAIREAIVEAGISKYEIGSPSSARNHGANCKVLVPGQVEDDRSIVCSGGSVTSNLELLRRVRERRPGAYIIYKPHPDVEAGHRVGAIPERVALAFADEVVRNEPISSLIDAADEVHVNTSLAGFEALLRRKPVTTYGVPFFAGWGLTTDLGPVPGRRFVKRSLDELVAAALLLYPRYLDPITRLPCPPEILIQRLSSGETVLQPGALVRIRQLQGKLKRMAAALWAK